MRCNIIGAGKLGKTLLYALSRNNLINLISVCNKNIQSAIEVVHNYPQAIAVTHLSELPPVELTFITSPDDTLQTISNKLAEHQILPIGSIVVHCSGVLDSSILRALKEHGCHIASFHPAKSFVKTKDNNAFKGVLCMVEGDAVAVAWLGKAFGILGATLIPIQPDKKPGYHAACVMASNYLVTLAATAEELMQKSGIEKNFAKKIIQQLMEGTLNNINQVADTRNALTGPLARGDKSTIQLHLEALELLQTGNFYKEAGLATLPYTLHSPEDIKLLQQLLRSK